MTSTGDPPADAAGPAGGRPSRARKAQGAGASVWDLPGPGTRGPKPRHDRAAITAIAVRIADAEGLEAVSMRRVAAELGIANMSLYNYVPSRDHLAQLMTDQLAGEYAYPATPAREPRAAIADLAGQAREIAGRHPWVAGLMQRPLPPGPNGLRYLDYFLGLMAGSGLDTGAKLEVIAIISGFATMYGAMQEALPADQAGSASAVQQNAAQARAFARAAAGGRYPNLAAALTAGGSPRSQDDIFASCIDRLIDLAGPGRQRL
jgi:AcrR family transcriptional regulator